MKQTQTPTTTYRTVTIDGDRYDISTSGAISHHEPDATTLAYVDLHPYYDGRKTARDLRLEVSQALGL